MAKFSLSNRPHIRMGLFAYIDQLFGYLYKS